MTHSKRRHDIVISFLPKELDCDRGLTLWRYMKLSTFFLLLEGTAFFPSVGTLRSGDPLEGDLHAEPEWLIGKLDDLSEGTFKKLTNWLLCKATKSEREHHRLNHDNASYSARFFADLYIRELAKRRVVWCWFASHTEGAGMWSIYGHNGIAVRTSIGGLHNALPNNRNFQIARIRYAGREPNAPDRFNPEARDDDPRIHRPHLVKGAEYECEKEVRVVTACDGEEKGVLVRGINVGRLIEEVVISPLLPREEAEAIKTLIGKHPWNSRPVIRRSSLLGERAVARYESLSAMDEFFGNMTIESGLPPLIASL